MHKHKPLLHINTVLPRMSFTDHKEIQGITNSIQGAIACAKERALDLKQQLADARARIALLEEELTLHKEKAAGNVTRDQLNKFYQSVRGRSAFDVEWEVFQKTFQFPSDDLWKRVMDWIEVIGPLVDLRVLPLDEDPGALILKE